MTATTTSDEQRARFNEVSDLCRDAYADGRTADARRALPELFALQMDFMRGTITKRLHAHLAAERDDILGYTAMRIIRTLENGNTLHWHMLFATYHNCIVDYGRRVAAKHDNPTAADGGFDQRTVAGDQVHGDPDRDAPERVIDHVDIVARVNALILALAEAPPEIRHPDLMLSVLELHLADIDNNAEIARLLGVPEGTLRREWNEFKAWARTAFPDLADGFAEDTAEVGVGDTA